MPYSDKLSGTSTREQATSRCCNSSRTGITVAGLPVLTSTHVDSGTVAWGIDKRQVQYVLRRGTTVERFDSITNDGLYIRAISRVGFGS